MGGTEIDLFGIDHMKVQLIQFLKIYAIPILGIFVWYTHFVQCASILEVDTMSECQYVLVPSTWHSHIVQGSGQYLVEEVVEQPQKRKLQKACSHLV